MNVFARSQHIVSKFQLRKVVEDWNVTPGDGHLYFTFRPPWVTSRVTDTFFALHPEQRAFASQNSKSTRSEGKSTQPLSGGSSIGATAASMLASVAAASSPGGAAGEVVRPGMA